MMGLKVYETLIHSCSGCPEIRRQGFLPAICDKEAKDLPKPEFGYHIKIPDWCPLPDFEPTKESDHDKTSE